MAHDERCRLNGECGRGNCLCRSRAASQITPDCPRGSVGGAHGPEDGRRRFQIGRRNGYRPDCDRFATVVKSDHPTIEGMESQESLVTDHPAREHGPGSNCTHGRGDGIHTTYETRSPFHQGLRNPLKHPFIRRRPRRDNEMKGCDP